MVFHFPRNKFPIFAVSTLAIIVFGSAAWVFFARTWDQAHVINRHVRKIAAILKDIDRTCGILEIQRSRLPIGFLTVKSFVGSEIGNISLFRPGNWRGPYVRDNPSIDGKILYEIVELKEGYCVVPGLGARLPNGLVVGRDIKLNHRVSLKKLTEQGGGLNYKGTPMGVFLDFPIGDWKADSPDKLGIRSKIWRLVDDFNQALVFTMNSCFGDGDDVRGHKLG